MAHTFVKNAHWDSHMGKLAHKQLLSHHFYVPCLTSLVSNICKQCENCAKNYPKQWPLPKLGVQHVGSYPFEDLEVDFTELPQTTGYNYLLVIVYILWVSRGFPHPNGDGPRSGPCFTKGNNSRDPHLHWVRQWTSFCGRNC
jgi:hypothetical protein